MSKETIDDEIDYYGVLSLKYGATDSEIRSSYFKLSKIWHPDVSSEKNANEMFSNINKAYTILKDKALKAKIDVKYKAKAHQQEKLQAMDSQKRKLREELEARESIAKKPKKDSNGIEKLKTEGYEKLYKLKNEEKSTISQTEANSDIVKVKWEKTEKLIDEEILKEAFSKFGEIDHILKKKGSRSAIVSFKKPESALSCSRFNWKESNFPMLEIKYQNTKQKEKKTEEHLNYESLTMMKLRQAAERQKLNEKLTQEMNENKIE
jgi:DnaJ homolog subfamily C member 17